MDSLFTQNQDFITPDNLEMSSDKVAEGNDKISELSKKGYQLLKENDTNHLRAILHTELIYFSFRFKFTYFFCFMQNKNMLIFTNLHTLFFYVQRISIFFAHFFGFYARTV